MIDLDERTLTLVLEIVNRHVPGCEVRLFGSRAHGKAGKFSDIDLAVVGDSALPDRVLFDLRDAFAESDLPYRVDVLDWYVIAPDFRTVIEDQGFTVIYKRENEGAKRV